MKMNWMNRYTASLLAAATGLLALPATSMAAPPLASATISDTQLNSTTWHYSLTLNDDPASTSPVGTFWFSWVPGKDFMTVSPTNINSPAGWTPAVTSSLGYAIQWVGAGSPDPVGGSLSGFSFDSTEPPATMFGIAPSYPGTNTLTSVAYSGTPFSDAGTTFVATPTAVPEPVSMALVAPALLLLARSRTRRAV